MTIRLLLWLCLLSCAAADAAPRFARVFADHMVLQRDRPCRIWGSDADVSKSLSVRFRDVQVAVKIAPTGNWEARLPGLATSGQGRELELLEDGHLVTALKDVVVGDVWLAAGQSNMQFPVRGMVKGLPEAQEWVDTARFPLIRFRRINDPVLADRGNEAVDLATTEVWKVMTPETVMNFSAVAAVFAREVHERLRVPIGVIDVSWGGKPIEPFIPREAFATPLLQRIRDLADADRLDELARLPGGLIIRNPEGHPGAIFNARMAPVTRFALRGFLWYQAESNAGRGEDPREYRHKMRALVAGWRARWQNAELPVCYVQLPSYPPASGWIRMREEQRRALDIPNTGMAVTIDVRGEDIHPPDKLSVGRRLAKLALAGTYGRNNVVAAGPAYRSHSVEGRLVRVVFDHAEDGLMVADKPDVVPARATPGAELQWFEVAGADGVWHAASARIDGGTVIVQSTEVARPVEVRYACHTQPQGGNLYNRAGLPAAPFCSRLEWLPWMSQ